MMRAALLVAALISFSAFADPVLPLPPLPSTSGPVSPQVLVPLLHPHGGAFDLRFVNVGQLVDLLYSDAMHVPHVIDNDVLTDQRVVSFQYDGKGDDLHVFVKTFLESLGFEVTVRDGVDFVGRKGAVPNPPDVHEQLVYRPRYRSAAYLAKLVQPLFEGRVGAGADNAVGSVAAQMAVPALSASGVQVSAQQNAMKLPSAVGSGDADELVFSGKPSEVSDLRKLLPELDTPVGEVAVRGWVYEVSDTNDKNSAFSIAASLLGGAFGGKFAGALSVSNGATGTDANALTFDGSFLKLAISALEADTRFKEVSDPHALVVSGQKVSLNVGEQVPTLGSISYQGSSGTPVQDVTYQSAGVIFNVSPTVLADSITLQIDEEISSFVQTTTGVNNSPTKNNRELQSTVAMKDGEVVVLGGLVQDSDSQMTNHEGWLPHFLDGRASSKGRTEVLLVLQVQRVDGPKADL